MRSNTSAFALPFTVLFTLSIAAIACSGSSEQGVGSSNPNTVTNGSGSGGLPCCHRGFIYKCANDSALNACSDAAQDDTTDCTKTSTACGTTTAPTDPSPPSSGKPPTPPTPPAHPPATKATGEMCGAASECKGAQCLVFGSGTTGFCSNICSNAGECPAQFRCQLVASLGNKVCTPIGDGKLGDACESRFDCASDLCITPAAGGTGFCSATCNAPADCGANWLCEAVGNSAGKYCTH